MVNYHEQNAKLKLGSILKWFFIIIIGVVITHTCYNRFLTYLGWNKNVQVIGKSPTVTWTFFLYLWLFWMCACVCFSSRLQRLVKDLVKQQQGQDSGQWASNKVSGLDRTLGEISRILEKQVCIHISHYPSDSDMPSKVILLKKLQNFTQCGGLSWLGKAGNTSNDWMDIWYLLFKLLFICPSLLLHNHTTRVLLEL